MSRGVKIGKERYDHPLEARQAEDAGQRMTKTIEAERVDLFITDKDGTRHRIETNPTLRFEPTGDVKVERGATKGAVEITMKVNITPAGKAAIAMAWNDYTESLKKLVLDRIAARFPSPSFSDAAGVLAEVLNEEMDAGFEFTDAQLEALAVVLDRFDTGDEQVKVADEWKDRV